MKFAVLLAGTTITISIAASAHALCIYKGVDNAKTTIREEFKDSTWVVRAKVLSARDHWSDEEDSWTIYRVRVLHTYKGRPKSELGHDVGGEYLLFLNPNHRHRGEPPQVEGTVFVNYSCGVSKGWREVTGAEREELSRLASARPLIRPAAQATFSRKGRRAQTPAV